MLPGRLERGNAQGCGECVQDTARVGQPARRRFVAFGNPRSTGSISSAPMTTNGSRPRNTQRQLACWANVPEMIGPRSEGSTHADDIAAKIFGRRCSG